MAVTKLVHGFNRLWAMSNTRKWYWRCCMRGHYLAITEGVIVEICLNLLPDNFGSEKLKNTASDM